MTRRFATIALTCSTINRHCGSTGDLNWVAQRGAHVYFIFAVLTFVETVTSMSGAVIVPDLSANQVAVKALKHFIAVNGFTKSVLQCDGHSGF